jgi:hypothetical protein
MNDKCDVHYNYLTFIVNIVIISAIFISCRKVNDEQFINRPLSGMLFYNKSSGMYKYDLKERSFQMVIAYPENKMILDDITMINNNKFIVEELVDGLYGISLVDKEIKFLRDGTKSVFIPEHNKILFYARDKVDKGRYKLYIAKIDTLNQPLFISNAPNTIKPYQKPVQISKDVVIFIGENDTLCAYNIATNSIKSTMISINALPMVWLKSANRLLCSWSGGGNIKIYSIDLQKKIIEEYNSLPDAVCIEYVEKIDMLLYSKHEYGYLGELGKVKYSLLGYFPKDKATMQIGTDLGISNFIYFPELK